MSSKLTLEEARAIVRRAIEKGKEVDWISTHAVADAGGNIVSLSRADGAPSGAAPLARAKAYLAAVTGRPTLLFANRMDAHPLRYFGYSAILPKPIFPGPGAVPIMRDGKVIGGYSSNLSSNTGGMKIEIDGKKLSRADIVTAYAVGAEYLEQHADVP
ncbi:MAG TPA: heme-binding protein [Burkholderiales bacterium]